MGRRNHTNRRPQSLKCNVEDRMARRAVAKIVEQSYRDEAREIRYEVDHTITMVFTDASYVS